ncbi:MAG: DUF4258 domain-containing protein [Alphaproteobacteria bacterium]|nr:DUF4258 domain-containing protein [Alphaproteobacteria bacterium]
MRKRRELKLEWLEDTLRDPILVKADERDPTLRLAFRKIPEARDKWLRVVYRMEKHTHVVVTAFFDRDQEKRK